MQRMFLRTLILAAVGAVTVMVVDDAQAGRRHRGGCGSSGGSYNGSGGGSYGGSYGGGGYYGDGYTYSRRGYGGGYTYSRGYGGNYGAYGPGVYSQGSVRGAAGMTYDANGRLIGPAVDRTARGAAGVDTRARVGGQISPSDRVRSGATIDASGRAVAPGTDVRARTTGDANADLNRNDGTIRGRVEGRARGDATIPNVPAPPDSGALPAPGVPAVPEPRVIPE